MADWPHACFDDVVVYPAQQLLAGVHGGSVHCAGPLWPAGVGPEWVRHRRGDPPRPVDDPPRQMPGPVAWLDAECLWGGCAVDHFGHFVAEFVHRILPAVHTLPELPLLMTTPPRGAPVPAFVLAVLRHLGVLERVRWIDQPCRVRRLWVFPQQEVLGGGPPAAAYLDLLDARVASQGPEPAPDPRPLFVSRALQAKGLAGEALLDRFFAEQGVRVVHPERLPLADQLAAYRSHRRLIFSEGSALHALQLLGRLPRTRVTVLQRRAQPMGEAFVGARVKRLRQVPLGGAMVSRLRVRGRPAPHAGLVFMDLSALRAAGRACLGPQADPHAWATGLKALAEQLSAAEGDAVARYLADTPAPQRDDVRAQLAALGRA
jgi:hypothetical protein